MREDLKGKFVLLSKVAKERKYAQEYLSLLARRGDLSSIRIGKRWYTKNEWMEDFIRANQEKKDFAKKAKPLVLAPEKKIEIKEKNISVSLFQERKTADSVPILIAREIKRHTPNVYEFSDAARVRIAPDRKKAEVLEKKPVFVRRAERYKNSLAEKDLLSEGSAEARNLFMEIRPRIFQNQPREKGKRPLAESRRPSDLRQRPFHDFRPEINIKKKSEQLAPKQRLQTFDAEFVRSGFTSPDFATMAGTQKKLSLQFAFLAVSVLVFFLLIQFAIVNKSDVRAIFSLDNGGKVAGAVSDKSGNDENIRSQSGKGALESLATASSHLDNADNGMRENFSFLHLMARTALEKKMEIDLVSQ